MKQKEDVWIINFSTEKAALLSAGAYQGKGSVRVSQNPDKSWKITIIQPKKGFEPYAKKEKKKIKK